MFRLLGKEIIAIYAENICLTGPMRGSSNIYNVVHTISRGTKVEKMLTIAPERYTAGFCMVAKVILWCI